MVVRQRPNRPLFARFYARVSPGMEGAGMAEHRDELLAGLQGRVAEIGAGNGLNFAHYPPTVTEVLAVEPEPYLRNLADEAAALAPVPVTVIDGVAEAIPAPDASVDAAVVCLVLCSVTDPRVAVAELARVIRPGGEVRFLEHVRADRAGVARMQRLLDATVWPRLTGGCHTHRDPVATLEQAGFSVASSRRVAFPDARAALPVTPHVLGTAIAPPGDRT